MTKPETDLERVDFTSLLAEPAWTTCRACGELTSPAGCFPCWQRGNDEEAKRRALECFPSHLEWAFVGGDALREALRSGGTARSADEIARSILAARRQNVTLLGPSGSGKTAMLTACARTVAPHVMYATAPDLLEAKAEQPFGAGPASIIAKAMATPLLVVDDFGHESPKRSNVVVRIIFKRFERGLGTWVATGLPDSNAVAAAYEDDGTARRLFQDRHALVIRLGHRGVQ